MIGGFRPWVLTLGFVVAVACPSDRAAGDEPATVSVTKPPWAADTAWLKIRAEQQAKTIMSTRVFHDFRFTDQQPDTGISFVHRVVEDAGLNYKLVHYDHGTGVAAADVDNDGHVDIYFLNQVGANELWRNNGNGTFENATKKSRAALADRISVGASFADFDNDGDQDLFVTTVRGGNVLFENDGTGRFTDISRSAGVDYVGHSSGALFFDFNNDGLLDLYVTNVGTYTTDEVGPGNYYVGINGAFTGHTIPGRSESGILYRNEGDSRFTDVTQSFGIQDTRWSGDVAPLDGNNDGWMDIYVLNMQGLDGYYENQRGKGFVDRSSTVFPHSSWGAMGIQVFDYDNDGDQDLFITDMHSDMMAPLPPVPSQEKRKAAMRNYNQDFYLDGGNGIWGNSFFRNNGDGSFSEISDKINAENYWPWGLSAGDLNADGFQDAFITASMNYPWRYAINSVLLNDAGTRFVDAEFAVGVEPRRAHPDGQNVTPWFEIDCAGANKGHRDCPTDSNAARVIVKGARGSRSSLIFDLDSDGDLDIVTAEFNAEPMVLVSNLSERREVNSISINLVGSKSNRNGFGATVIVKAEDQAYTQQVSGKTGYLSQSSLPLYFGLGKTATIDAIEVRWPSGIVQNMVGPIASGQTLRIVEQE